jgi:hypothetical protein
MTDRAEFLAGERTGDVLIYLAAEAVSKPKALADSTYGEAVDGGVVLVLDGEDARGAFRNATGIDIMGFAQEASGTDGAVADDCLSATCPNEGDGDDHTTQFVFAFAEEQNEEVGGIYAEGDVIHAYASCLCGEAFSEKWLIE